MKTRRPPPTAPKARPASEVLSPERLAAIADTVSYAGSPFHKDSMSFVGAPAPRVGAVPIEDVLQSDEAPDCTLCPRRWARQKDAVTRLLRDAIRRGFFEIDDSQPDAAPERVWAIDPEDDRIVYQARRLPGDANQYKGYPLTRRQAKQCPFRLE
jgi:hypothetical protein